MDNKKSSLVKKSIRKPKTSLLPKGTMEAMQELGPSFSLAEFCVMMGIRNRMTIYRWMREGKIKLGVDYFQLPSGHYRISGLAIKRLLGIPEEKHVAYRTYSVPREKSPGKEGTDQTSGGEEDNLKAVCEG